MTFGKVDQQSAEEIDSENLEELSHSSRMTT